MNIWHRITDMFPMISSDYSEIQLKTLSLLGFSLEREITRKKYIVNEKNIIYTLSGCYCSLWLWKS